MTMMIITYTLQRSLQMRFLCPLPVALPNSSFCRSIGVQTAAVVTGSSEFNLIKERIAAALTQLFSSSWAWSIFILFLLPWSRIQISESIYLLRARVVSIHTITLIEFLPFIYRSCKSRCQQKQFLQAEHLFIFIVEEENWDTCFGFSFCEPPPIFFRVYNYIHILLIDWWHLTKKSICKIFANVYQDVFACQTQTGFCFWEFAFYWNGMYVQMPDI